MTHARTDVLRRTTLLILAILSFVFLLPPRAESEITNNSLCWPRAWPWQDSDLQVDPSLTTGTLDNGLRYIVKENGEPRGRVAVHLLIGAGSLHEDEDQRGLAHYLEHMMFKGSRNYPPGTLVNYFQSIGMDFGNDANAHTAFDRTVYNIFLPSGKEEELRRGLLVLADYARHATLGEQQVNEERGVILAEKRARDSASYRTQVAAMEFAFRGTRLAERMVIGSEEVLRRADGKALRAFYDRWYRPENMTLVVVGDVDRHQAVRVIGDQFGPLTASGPAPVCAPFGSLQHRGIEIFHHYEPELGKTNVSIETFWPRQPQRDSTDFAAAELTRIVGDLIVGYRLERLQEEADAPFTQALYRSGDLVERIGYGTISAQTDQARWRSTVAQLDRTLRQALLYGFSEEELQRARDEVLAELDARVATANSEDSRRLASMLVDHLASYRVYQSPQQERQLYGGILDRLTLARVNEAFRQLWGHDSRLVSVTGDARLEGESREQIREAYTALQEDAPEEFRHQREKTFPYLPLAAPSSTARQEKQLAAIDSEQVVFANSLVLNLKRTPFREKSFNIIAAFGEGEQSEPLPGMAMIGEDMVNLSGTGAMTQAEVERLLAGSSVNLRFRIGEAAFTWVGGALEKDAALLLQLLHTVLYDPGWRKSRFDLAMKNAEQLYQKKERDIEGAMPLHVTPFLAGGNVHFGLVPWQEVARLTYDGVAAWLAASMPPRDLELTVVGDFQRDDMVRLVERYFAGVSLQAPQPVFGKQITFPAGGKLEVAVDTSIDKALLVLAWPTDDAWDIARTRRLLVLATIFDDRLRKVVREKLGAAYSPSASSFTSRVYPGYGYLYAQILVSPGDEEVIAKEIRNIAEDLRRNGIGEEELQRGKKPTLTSIGDTIRTNGYWLSSVLHLSSRHPVQLEWPTTIVDDFAAISKEDINRLAAEYLDNRRVAEGRAFPRQHK